MKGFEREDTEFSLCGLNCALCTMKLGGYCPGCGGGAGNQGCAIARCAVGRGGMEYCFQCGEYPCKRYSGIDEFDSFITHRNQLGDMEKARNTGMDNYRAGLSEKAAILGRLLSDYNDGRRKTFFCLAVNLLELSDIRAIMSSIGERERPDMTVKERAELAAGLFEECARAAGIVLKLRRKPKTQEQA